MTVVKFKDIDVNKEYSVNTYDTIDVGDVVAGDLQFARVGARLYVGYKNRTITISDWNDSSKIIIKLVDIEDGRYDSNIFELVNTVDALNNVALLKEHIIVGTEKADSLLLIGLDNSGLALGADNDVVNVICAKYSQAEGGVGNDTLRSIGSTCAWLKGGAGDDILSLYADDSQVKDRLEGGSGSDTYKILTKLKKNSNIIIDQTTASQGDNDVIVLSKVKAEDIVNYQFVDNNLILTDISGGTVKVAFNGSLESDSTISKFVFTDRAINKDDILDKISDNTSKNITESANNKTYKGSNLEDIFNITGNNNVIIAGGNNDIITVNGSGNSIYGDAGDDKITVTGLDTYYSARNGSAYCTVDIDGGSGNDVIVISGTKTANVNCESGDNTIEIKGLSAFQVSRVSEGNITTASGNDTITIKNGGFYRINSGSGIDTIDIQEGSNIVYTSDGADIITLNSMHSNIIDMGDGDDYITISSNKGNNKIYGGKGNDTFKVTSNISSTYHLLEGASGNDIYEINSVSYKVVIDNRSHGTSDYDVVKINQTFSYLNSYYRSYYDSARDFYAIGGIAVFGVSSISKIELADMSFAPSAVFSLAQRYDAGNDLVELNKANSMFQSVVENGFTTSELAKEAGYLDGL